ncbi:LysR family transcriptional regulator [Silvimonas iriomotensis]|uniref:LysR family transcriptional regulator n=1 Tax=Silvimonas iriomotensis TaxID=449662 RepID=A0ABQ2P7Y6_9NEIS|nr:LysR family transcriptional regulator [Silvimonas iriomotensis]GGP20192.1 LysR family transcriptional regulator [Silvimonas iriomotensis]
MAGLERLSGIAVFVQVVESGSFSAAASRLHLSRSAVGKTVARLEVRLGVRLFHRTTRNQSLTDEGQMFYQRCLRVLAELDNAEDELAQGRREPTGRMRITMPVLFGRRCIAPVLLELAERWPRLQLELAFSDRKVDLVEEGFDLAIRSGPLTDTPGLKMRPLGEHNMLICAAPAWLARHGTPHTLAQLAGQEAIFYGRSAQNADWSFQGLSGEALTVQVVPRIALDDLEVMMLAACQGLGVVRLPSWLAAEALQRGELVELFFPERTQGIAVAAIWPNAPQTPLKVRWVLDALLDKVAPILRTSLPQSALALDDTGMKI